MGQHTDFTGKCGKPNHKRASPMTYQQCVLQITSPIQAIHSLREVKQKSQCYQCYQAPSLVQVVGTSSVKHHTEFYHQDHWETIKQTLCLYIYIVYTCIYTIYIYISLRWSFLLGFPTIIPVWCFNMNKPIWHTFLVVYIICILKKILWIMNIKY